MHKRSAAHDLNWSNLMSLYANTSLTLAQATYISAARRPVSWHSVRQCRLAYAAMSKAEYTAAVSLLRALEDGR